MRINFDLDDLQAFLAVDSTGSFHRAASQLAMSQSAVTRRVKKLEDALDTTLFDRTTRKVKPTLAAKRLRPRAEAILQDTHETARAMRDQSAAYAHQRSLIVTLAAIPTVITDFMPRALHTFREAGFSSRIRFLDRAANEVSEAVAEGEADFGICSMPSLDPGLGFETLFDDRIVLALNAGHPLARRDIVTWDDLSDAEVILPARGTGNRVLIDDTLARMKNNLHWTFETERSTTALALVSNGVGAALLPLSLLRSSADDRVVWRSVGAPRIARPIGLLSRLGHVETAQVAALKSAIRAACRDMTDLG